jgi:NADPH:quinone reductase-like Zn-dependent oxidoreductase
MRAAQIDGFGGNEVVQLRDLPAPEPGPGQVLLEIHGSSVNPVDIAVRSGWLQQYVPLTPPVTLGTDVAGVVSAVGDGVTQFAVGDQVFGSAAVVMGGSGAFAEWAVTSPGLLAKPPANVDLPTAATLPLAGISALQAVEDVLEVRPGARVLVHGAPGGVGLVALHLAAHHGAQVVATARNQGVGYLQDLGVAEVVDTSTTDLGTVEPFDLTFDLVGADAVLPVTVTKPGGRAVGLRLPPDQEAAAAKEVLAVFQGTQITTERLDRLRDYVEKGVVRPHVARTFALDDVAEALAAKEAGGVHGKIAISTR